MKKINPKFKHKKKSKIVHLPKRQFSVLILFNCCYCHNKKKWESTQWIQRASDKEKTQMF